MLVCAFPCATLHTRPRVQRAPGIPCSLCFEEGQRNAKTSATVVLAKARTHTPRRVLCLHRGRELCVNNSGRGLWIPAFAGMTPRRGADNIPPPSFRTSEARSGTHAPAAPRSDGASARALIPPYLAGDFD